MQKPFIVTSRVISHLGESLIKNESIALLELVKNSYDANARHCRVDFTYRGSELSQIRVEDDGVGMSLDTVQNVWLVIGTDNKKQQLQKPTIGRLPLGEKGIGRLGVHKLGKTITMYTKTREGKEVQVSIDWTKLSASTVIDDFTIDVQEYDTPTYFTDVNQHGTVLVIDNLKSDWTRRKIREVYRDLTSLNSPFARMSDSFEVDVQSNASVFEGLPNLNDILNVGMYVGHCEIECDRIVDFKYEFRPWKTLKIDPRVVINLNDSEVYLQRRVYQESGNRIKKELEPFSLSSYKIGRIVIDVVIYEKDASVFSYMNMEKKSLTDYLRENGGIRVYRDDVRVYNYGEKGNDWLGLDRVRINRAGGSINQNLVIGAVSLDRRLSVDLQEKTNREGFIEDEAYNTFVDAVKWGFDKIIRLRNADKNRLISIYKKGKRTEEPVVSDLGEVIEIVKTKVSSEESREEILKLLSKINEQYTDVRDVLIRSANAGLNLGSVVHEMGKEVAQLKGLVTHGGDKETILKLVNHLSKIVDGYSIMITKSEVKENSINDVIETVVDNLSYRFHDHRVRVFSNYRETNYCALFPETEAIGALTNLLDNSIYWTRTSREENNRLIYLYVTKEIEGYISIAVCDNGPGFNIDPEVAKEPFVSGKPLGIGMGLGLHITNEIMKAMNGKLLILDPNELEIPAKAKDKKINGSVVVLCFKTV
jgi:signal transduction histidine kinase